ncbi:MAG: DNA methyltransferase [Candidatus Thorarchaeota archaeon]|jgi:DNA modification methylase
MAGRKLNDLDGKEWVKSTKSWFVVNPRSRSKNQMTHPAKFPEELVTRFVEYFTRAGGWVIDPFAGVASTMVACKTLNRSSVGVELNPEFIEIGHQELNDATGSGSHHILTGDSLDIAALLETQFGEDVPEFDYLITSPPYFNMLRKSRGGNETVHKERGEKGFKQYYSRSSSDLGNIESYEEYLECVGEVLDAVFPYMSNGAYLTVVVQNMRDEGNIFRPIAWDLACRFSETYELRQEQVWCQDNKRLGCWGFPSTYVSNVHHHYCLILQKHIKSDD